MTMKIIKLTQNKHTIVDDEDYEYLKEYKWRYNNGYAVRASPRDENGKQISFRMHRVIFGLTSKDVWVDHINGNGLDNRKCNLRIVNRQQNQMNRKKRKKGSSEYKGVTFYKNQNKWVATIYLKNKRIHLGYFKKEIEAAIAYNEAALIYHKEYARLNKL